MQKQVILLFLVATWLGGSGANHVGSMDDQQDSVSESGRINAGPIIKILLPLLSLLTVTTVTTVTTVSSVYDHYSYCLTGMTSDEIATIKSAQNACLSSSRRSFNGDDDLDSQLADNGLDQLPPRGHHVATASSAIASSMSTASPQDAARFFLGLGPLFTLSQTSTLLSLTTQTVAYTATTNWYCIYTYLTFC